jgi:hypothetical protein
VASLLASCSAYSSTLKTEVTYSSETSVYCQWTAWCYVPEDRTLRNHCCENLKSYKHPVSLIKPQSSYFFLISGMVNHHYNHKAFVVISNLLYVGLHKEYDFWTCQQFMIIMLTHSQCFSWNCILVFEIACYITSSFIKAVEMTEILNNNDLSIEYTCIYELGLLI